MRSITYPSRTRRRSGHAPRPGRPAWQRRTRPRRRAWRWRAACWSSPARARAGRRCGAPLGHARRRRCLVPLVRALSARLWDVPGKAGAGGPGVRQTGPAAGGTSWATRRPRAWRRRCWNRPRGCRSRSRRAAGGSRSAAPAASASRCWRPRPRQRRARPAPQSSRARKLAACPGRARARRCAGSRARTPRAWCRSAACRPRPRWPASAPTASSCSGRPRGARCATAGAWPARRRARPSASGAWPCSNTLERLRRMQATPFWPLHGTQAGLPPSGWCDLPQSLLPWVLTHAQKPGRCMAASAATARLAVGSRSGVLRLVQAAAPRLPVVVRGAGRGAGLGPRRPAAGRGVRRRAARPGLPCAQFLVTRSLA